MKSRTSLKTGQKPLIDFVISISHSVFNLQIKRDMDEISEKYKNWPDCVVNLRVTLPLIAEKATI